MRWDEIDESLCPLARTLSVVGDRWTLLILREALMGAKRFDEFQRFLAAAPHLISSRLKKLVDHKVLERRRYQDRPARYEYHLTRQGMEFYPAIVALADWGEKWLKNGEGPAVTRVHKGCSHRLKLVPTCADCGAAVTTRDQVQVTLTPRYAAERARRAAGLEPTIRKKAKSR